MSIKTIADAEEIADAVKHGRSIACKYGPLHGAWDAIFDLEAYMSGKQTQLTLSHEEWLEQARSIRSMQCHTPS